MDFILNGQAQGSIAATLMQNQFDTGSLRPFIGKDGRSYITINSLNPATGKFEPQAIPTTNAVATLRKDDWITLDRAVVAAAKPRLKLVGALRAGGLTYTMPNGMASTVLQTETQSDISGATISMDGLRKSEGDRPVFELSNLPLPLIHKDFSFSARQVMASRQGGSPLDTSTAELAARRVAEEAEKLAIGTLGFQYGGGLIYGLVNFPSRLTKVLTNPASTGWTPKTTVLEVLDMRQKSIDALHYGPWMLFVGTAWDAYLDADYSDAKGDNTLRERIAKIQGINGVESLDYLSGYQMVLVQWTADVIREVIGMDVSTVQWESQGGMQINFKVMAILVPQLRGDITGKTGIVHGNTA
jgi:uncharacterized linocin/CFP29 family protein